MDGDTYLFIDGEYLWQIHRQAMLDFFGVDGELNMPFGRLYLFDSHRPLHKSSKIKRSQNAC
jgi:hypothetical protein